MDKEESSDIDLGLGDGTGDGTWILPSCRNQTEN
jgi:hypothetical protein